MKRLLAAGALALAGVMPAPNANALVRYCYNSGECVYDSGGYWCEFERGSNGNTREICVGATGVRTCYNDFGYYSCEYTP